MEALLLLVMGAVCIGCFLVGAKVGQTVSKGEEVKLPTLNPMEAYTEHRARQQAQKEQDRYNAILGNIEAYDGTPNGQEDVPRG